MTLMAPANRESFLAWTLWRLIALVACAGAASGARFKYMSGSYLYPDTPLVRAVESVFPPELLEEVAKECKLAHEVEAKERAKHALKDGKASTYWMDKELFTKPRNAIEAAVAHLAKVNFPEGLDNVPGGVAGGEWWVQTRSTNENIGFHYDKDEGTASEEQWMKMPLISTISYISHHGAPTLLFNQTTNRGGYKETPEVPVKAWLAYPARNRHVMFHGNLQHGVVGELGEASGPEKRVTFLVNWWDKKPVAPYCNRPPADSPILSFKTAEQMSTLLAALGQYDGTPTPTEFARLEVEGLSTRVRGDESPQRTVEVQFPPTDRLRYAVPREIARHTVHEMEWEYEQVDALVAELDLMKRMVTNKFFRATVPNIVGFRDPLDDTKDKAIRDMEDALFDIAQEYRDKVNVYSGSPKNAGDAMKHFQVSPKNLPAVVLHDVKGDKKYIMPVNRVVNSRTLKRWVKAYFGGRLQPIGKTSL